MVKNNFGLTLKINTPILKKYAYYYITNYYMK